MYQSQACPHDNSPLIHARITNFVVQLQKTSVKIPTVLWGDQPWRSNLTWKLNFTSFWACTLDSLSHDRARITKFGPEMHLSTVNIPFASIWWSSTQVQCIYYLVLYTELYRPPRVFRSFKCCSCDLVGLGLDFVLNWQKVVILAIVTLTLHKKKQKNILFFNRSGAKNTLGEQVKNWNQSPFRSAGACPPELQAFITSAAIKAQF